MGFMVQFSDEAKTNIDDIYRWIRQHSAQGAERWYLELLNAIESLATAGSTPGNIAAESENIQTEIRHLVFKSPRGRPYRILFMVVSQMISVLSVRGPGMNYFESGISKPKASMVPTHSGAIAAGSDSDRRELAAARFSRLIIPL